MIQRGRLWGAVAGLLLLSIVLSACGGATPAQHWPGLTEANGILYVISGTPQRVYLLDAATGVQKGTYAPQGQLQALVFWSPVTVASGEGATSPLGGNLAFVGYAAPQARPRTVGLFAFDSTTGQDLWSVPTDDIILAAPTYADGVVYFGTSDGKTYAVDVQTRLVKPGWPFQAKEAIWASPLVADGRVYVASVDHHVYCLDAESAAVLWDFEAGGALAAQPEMDASTRTLYVGAFDARVYAIDAAGQAISEFNFRADNWIWSEIVLADGRLYVTSLDGKLYALDPASGAVLPPYPVAAGDALRAGPAAAGNLIVVASQEGKLTAVQGDTGVTRWQWPSGIPQAQILTTPLVVGDTVYVVLMNGQVYALMADTGIQRWIFTPPTAQ